MKYYKFSEILTPNVKTMSYFCSRNKYALSNSLTKKRKRKTY